MNTMWDGLKVLASLQAFREVMGLKKIKVIQLNALVSALIYANIPFQLTFDEGTRDEFPSATLQISITPTVVLQLTFYLCL